MNRQQLKAILLAAGFKEKLQPDGTMDLNPYCYTAGAALLQAGREECAQVCDAQAQREPYGHAKHAAVMCADGIRAMEDDL